MFVLNKLKSNENFTILFKQNYSNLTENHLQEQPDTHHQERNWPVISKMKELTICNLNMMSGQPCITLTFPQSCKSHV